jgi:formamidopyrimidine-DNA glycosylase
VPELPEVEWATRHLRAWLEGKTIASARVPPSRVVHGPVVRLVTGRKVVSIERRGKWIHLALSGGASLYAHLGMTGKWLCRSTSDGPQRFEKARFDVRGASVRYTDPRMFGRLVALASGELPRWTELGPDPLVDGVDVDDWQERLSRSRRSIKETLMDQTVVAGVGNIQASESLWRARIHPVSSARAVARDRKRVRALGNAVLASIDFTLKAQAREEEIAYVEEPGSENPFRVYGREGERCPRKDGTIRRVEQGGRGSYFCPACQKRYA